MSSTVPGSTPVSRPEPTRSVSRLAVVGTAGHIDHGKTALVRRLTGIDTDRLPEEKRRGISIDLGFASLTTPAGARVGIVDVPGHERFVKNMLAGAGGIDLVLLVIAADEGVMPQTREHLAIVQLLGVRRGVVVLTKADLAEREWIDLVARDVRALLKGTALAEAPIVEFSAVTGQGERELLETLDRELAALDPRGEGDAARLPVDRVFVVEGFGTVVTGTLWRGTIRNGDSLELLPRRRPVRVRRVQVHGATVDAARAGQRTAVALHGVSKEQVARGDWLVTPGSLEPTRSIDVRFELLPDYPRSWKSGVRVRFHLGAGEQLGRLVLLEGQAIEPGASALAQLRLEKPTVAARGDRFVIRSYSPMRTVGGGTVIEPVAGARKRRHAEGLRTLSVHETGSLGARLLEILAAQTSPATTASLAVALHEPAADIEEALRGSKGDGRIVEIPGGRWISADRWRLAREEVSRAVSKHAERFPARFGIPKGELKSALKETLDPSLFDAVFEDMLAAGELEQRGERVRPGDRPWEPPAAMTAALERLESDLEGSGFAVAENAVWQGRLGDPALEVTNLGHFLGRLVRVSQDLTYTRKQMDLLRARLLAWFTKHPALKVSDFKEIAGVSRKWAVPLLEHCDRVGWTVRSGDERKRGGQL